MRSLRKLTIQDLAALPVVDADHRIVEVVSRNAIMRAYRNALMEHERGAAPG